MERSRRIYYDTDGIMETQTQRFMLCPRCSGVNIINSGSDRGHHILAITIPRDGCASCVDAGYKLYKDAPLKYTNVYLADGVHDVYETKQNHGK